jgi:hypothetical protein
LDNGIGIHTDRRGRDTSLEEPAGLGSDGFDSAQRKAELGDILVGGDHEIIHCGQRDRH